MPEKTTIQRAQQDKRAGKAPTTQAGEFVTEESHSRRQAWRPLYEASHRDRLIKGPQGGCEAQAAEEWADLAENSTERARGLS